MKTIGIKLADGTFYPILEEGSPKQRMLDLTTVKDNQTKVQIDLYRSENGTMDDAEYVDTLEVSTLNPHPNGEPELHLSVGIDENNELKAEVVDSETGTKSETQVNLITRSSQDRLQPNDFELADFELPSIAEDVTPEQDNNNEQDNTTADDHLQTVVDSLSEGNPLDITPETIENIEPHTETESDLTEFDTEEPFSFDSFTKDDTLQQPSQITSDDDTTVVEQKADEDFDIQDTTEESVENIETEQILEDSQPVSDNDGFVDVPVDSFDTETFNLPDIDSLALDNESDTDEIPQDITPPELNEEDFGVSDLSGLDISDEEGKDLSAEDFDLDKTETSDEPVSADTTDFDLDLPSLDLTENDQSTDNTFDLPDFGTIDTDVSQNDEAQIETDSFDLPDFDTDSDTNQDDPLSEQTFSLPDFDDIKIDDTDSKPEVSGISSLFDDSTFDDPLFNTASTDNFTAKFNTDDLDIPPAPVAASGSAFDFSDLYDKDTLAGDHATPYDDEDDEDSSRTRLPVLICVLCAIICLIATAMILFVFPSKYNVLKQKSTEQSSSHQQVSEEQTAVAQLPDTQNSVEITVTPIETAETQGEKVKAPEAQEDKIIISPTPDVVPVPKPPVTEAAKKKDVKYHIKWGDTLWDLADSYYKNPWRYPKIANYNHIKNPDLIISGTDILIPVE